MQVRLLKDCSTTDGPKPAGTVIECNDSWRLVKLGIAEAIDEHAIGAMRAIGLDRFGKPLIEEVPPPAPQVVAPTPTPTPTPKPTPKPVVKPVDGK